MKKIVIAGAAGFIGKYLSERYKNKGDQVLTINRSGGDCDWTNLEKMSACLEGADLIINLTGKSVNCRYNEKNKTAILQSRLQTTAMIGKAIRFCRKPPRLWINAGTATIYRHTEDRPMTEENGEIGSGFSVEVAKAWESAFFSFSPFPATRQAMLRMAIVLGTGGGVIKPLANLVRSGLGGKQGKGTQMFSWIHIEDLARIIDYIADHDHHAGVFNCSSPQPITNEKLMRELRMILKKPFGLPAPTLLLRAGAVLIRTETELILKSRWVIPERLRAAGFVFQFPGLSAALKDIFKK